MPLAHSLIGLKGRRFAYNREETRRSGTVRYRYDKAAAMEGARDKRHGVASRARLQRQITGWDDRCTRHLLMSTPQNVKNNFPKSASFKYFQNVYFYRLSQN